MKKLITLFAVAISFVGFTAFAQDVPTPTPVFPHGHPPLPVPVIVTPTAPAKAPIVYAYKLGDKGLNIKTLQTFLNNQGANPTLKVDGIYGKLTQMDVNIYIAK